ncbi:MAG: aminotransferase class V-fold PLP-dependent enzyme, partial [Verrucomicrobiota bacterium]
MEDIASKAFATRAIHAGTPPEPETGARQFPVFQTTSFVFPSPEEAAARFNLEKVGYIYSRLTNPTVGALEARVAALEGGPAATATSSGHAAQIMAFFPLMGPGDHIVAARKLYGGSINQMTHAYKKFGWEVTFVDFDRLDDIRAALTPKTKALFCESLANPGGSVTDLEAVAAIAHEAGVPLVVDNTLATPYLCRPLEHGADIVVNSTTKFLTGNGTSIGGVVTDSGKFDW